MNCEVASRCSLPGLLCKATVQRGCGLTATWPETWRARESCRLAVKAQQRASVRALWRMAEERRGTGTAPAQRLGIIEAQEQRLRLSRPVGLLKQETPEATALCWPKCQGLRG
mmetsp:Transcript_23453/g.67640  ORF Transcript_23453/g.67640 Transcript_23453/m.67640 type:complete len:113 (+) Transcript_23453:241-579(+)